MTFSPGPWAIKAEENFDNIIHVIDADGCWIAELVGSDDDARLIAAAPELLDLARQVASGQCQCTRADGLCEACRARELVKRLEAQ